MNLLYNMFKFVTLLFITGSGDFGFRENEGKKNCQIRPTLRQKADRKGAAHRRNYDRRARTRAFRKEVTGKQNPVRIAQKAHRSVPVGFVI